MTEALDGIGVLDLSRILAGPSCTQTLADLGAEVWKVEHPQRGDDTRAWRPPEVGEVSTYFLCCNRSKKSLAIDIAAPEGAALVRRLAAEADVVVENFRPGALAHYGLDWDSLRVVNPRLVYCSISGYGRSGRGQHLDIALLDSAVAVPANVASGHLGTGAAPGRYGNAHATVVPYQLFATRDGVIALAVGNDQQFVALCERVLRRPDLAADPRYTTNRQRVLNRESLIPALEACFEALETADCLGRLRGAGVPAGTLRSVPEVFAAPEVAARHLLQQVEKAGVGRLTLPGSPLKLSDTPVRPAAPPPDLGEHTAEVLERVIDLEAAALDALRAAGVIGPGSAG